MTRRGLLGTDMGPIAYVLGTFMLVIAANLLLPIACSLIYGENDLFALASSAVIIALIGAPMSWKFRGRTELQPRHAFFLASTGWFVVSAVSGLPFMIHGSIPSFTDAFFEMMSGYTTTGATILRDIEALPHGLLLWRSQTHLIGGMGFVTLAVLFLPHGLSGLRLFRADSSPGQVITRERFTERNRDAMRYLWTIYLVLNLVQIVLMCFGGMSIFDSVCHAFGTLSTSGYSPYNASIGHYNNAYFDWVITLFMFLGGTSFVLFFYAYKRDWKSILKTTEFRWYTVIVLFFCLYTGGALWIEGTYDFFNSLRHGSFQVVSLLTTTGYTTVDYELWPHTAQMALFIVSWIGGCAGSTSSGIKVVYLAIVFKFGIAFVRKLFFQPLAVVSVRLNGERVDNDIIGLGLCLFIANILLVGFGGIVMSISDGLDPLSAMSSVLATLANIGPGFGQVGPSHSFADLSDFGKWFLSANMLIGRLELFSVLVLFYPSFWRN